MGLWGYIISQTQHSPGRLLVFGTVCVGATWVVGSLFAGLTTNELDAKQRKARMDELPFDNRRLAQAQQQRLSAMLKDIAAGRDDEHWRATMRGTLVPHPNAENKTQGVDNERLARLASK